MADKKVTDLPALSVADDADLFPVVDVSGNITKKVTRAGLVPEGSISIGKLNGGATAGVYVSDGSGLVTIRPFSSSSNTTGTNGSKADGTTLAAQNYDFKAGIKYLIMGSAQQVTPLGGSSVWNIRLRIGSSTLINQRIGSPTSTGAPQIGTSLTWLYEPGSDTSSNANLYAERETGTNNLTVELPRVLIIPIVAGG